MLRAERKREPRGRFQFLRCACEPFAYPRQIPRLRAAWRVSPHIPNTAGLRLRPAQRALLNVGVLPSWGAAVLRPYSDVLSGRSARPRLSLLARLLETLPWTYR